MSTTEPLSQPPDSLITTSVDSEQAQSPEPVERPYEALFKELAEIRELLDVARDDIEPDEERSRERREGMSKHTLGPLTVHGPSAKHGPEESCDWCVRDETDHMIAEYFEVVGYEDSSRTGYDRRPAEANARLGAAAPDLLEAAEALLKAPKEDMAQSFSDLRAAVEKARVQ